MILINKAIEKQINKGIKALLINRGIITALIGSFTLLNKYQ